MRIIDLGKCRSEYNTAVALGNFDGIHRGHQYLIEDTIKKANKKNIEPSILLFKNHTKLTINKNNIYILTSNNQKLKILEEMGIETVYTMDFDEDIMKLSSKEFIKNIIVDKLKAKIVTVGFDYRFGYKASGNSEYLKKLGEAYGFETNIIMPICIDNEIISSTKIRNLIQLGNIEKANKFLGRHYSIIGNIVSGSSRGRKLGYPTANIELIYNYKIPKPGVYKSITILEGKQFVSLTSIGNNPTFNEKDLKIENYILDFNENIYGKTIEIQFVNFIRENMKFKTAEELINQINKDVEYIKKINNIYN